MKKNTRIVDIDGQVRENPDFPVAILSEQEISHDIKELTEVVDPVLCWAIVNNLYGRIFTLIEATTDQYKLKSVKDLFSKEIKSWETDVYDSARELANGGNSTRNLYTRNQNRINTDN